ncbi:2-oxoglutarate and iron-dependent oxygenase domain-containing protein 3-like [Mya arenaria]|uniref:2-oxoglutarate and iron-dependent oxygenase domain-containing protein 3-like n=1 Tax=Mya arenaria TaxID=6604 RepID=UPI0022DFDECC|nr:2-oxoglutarate and iron-dependent oxygenase domain-containing protein 3-like [Mya arenaria]
MTTPKVRKQKHQNNLPKKDKDSKVLTAQNGGIASSKWKYVAAVLSGLTLLAAAVLKHRYGSPGQTTFARADVKTDELVNSVPCSSDYQKDPFKECKPSFCGRVVRDNVVTSEEAEHLLGVAKRGLAYGGSNGGASILDLHSGALSKNDKFINVYSILPDGEGFTEQDFSIYRRVKDKIHRAIAEHFHVPLTSLFLTKPTFFSRMNTSEAKTMHDEYWHPHIDRVTYGSFFYTSLLYLTTYGTDFTGGRFIFTDQGHNMTVEPRLGRVSFFTSGSENVHYVEKLTSGVRYAVTISFTCDPSMAIADPNVR